MTWNIFFFSGKTIPKTLRIDPTNFFLKIILKYLTVLNIPVPMRVKIQERPSAKYGKIIYKKMKLEMWKTRSKIIEQPYLLAYIYGKIVDMTIFSPFTSHKKAKALRTSKKPSKIGQQVHCPSRPFFS